MLNLFLMNVNVIICQMTKNIINGLALMKHHVKDLFTIMMLIHLPILLILFTDVSCSININQKKYKQIMVPSLLGIKIKCKKFILYNDFVLKNIFIIIK